MSTPEQELCLTSLFGSSPDNCVIFDDTYGVTETELETSLSPITDSSSNSPQYISSELALPFDLADISGLDPQLDANLVEFTLTSFPDIPNTEDLLADLFGPDETSLSPELSAEPDHIVTLNGVTIDSFPADQEYLSSSTNLNKDSSPSTSSGDFSIEMDEANFENDMIYSYSDSRLDEDSDSVMDISNCRQCKKRSHTGSIKRPRENAKRRNTSSLLPYTVHDISLEDKISLNNEDLINGRPGERLQLTREEKDFMKSEGFAIPTHLPLTKEEVRALKTVRRKIRNKISAKNSRAKKQDYVVGLEQRVSICTEENAILRQKLRQAESDKRNLFSQVRNLREMLSRYMPESNKSMLNPLAGTSLCLCMLTFLMVFSPSLSPLNGSPASGVVSGPANIPGGRRLLQESDLSTDLGDPYDITVRPSPAWKFPPQSPMIDLPKKVPTSQASTAASNAIVTSTTNMVIEAISNSSEDLQLHSITSVRTEIEITDQYPIEAGYVKEL